MTTRWLSEMLRTQGHVSESGLTRRARVTYHRPCRAVTLAGYDADIAAMDAWCDLGALNAEGEVLALLDGRRTYELHAERLHHRDRWIIRSRPASRTVVLAEHRCGHPLPAAWLLPVPPTKPAPSTDCEF